MGVLVRKCVQVIVCIVAQLLPLPVLPVLLLLLLLLLPLLRKWTSSLDHIAHGLIFGIIRIAGIY